MEFVKSISRWQDYEAGYVEAFCEQLDKLDAEDIVKKLHKLTHDEEPVLMCHCGKDKFCHRHIVAEWLELETGQIIEEYGIGETKRFAGRLI